MNVEVKNCPKYVEQYDYIVARLVEGDLWFWGAYSDLDKATKAANEVKGIVVNNR